MDTNKHECVRCVGDGALLYFEYLIRCLTAEFAELAEGGCNGVDGCWGSGGDFFSLRFLRNLRFIPSGSLTANGADGRGWVVIGLYLEVDTAGLTAEFAEGAERKGVFLRWD